MGNPSRRGVLAGGNWIIDHVKMLDAWPSQDTLATITAQSDGNGGCPYNVLKNLSRLQCGFPLEGVGLLGRDADGEMVLRDCREHGIDASGLQQTDAAPTSYTDVMTVSNTGRRTFFHQHGANALLGEEHFSLARSQARIFYFGYLCLLRRLDALTTEGRTGASRLLELARNLGMVTIADLVSIPTNDFPSIVNPSLPHLDYLLLNEFELACLTQTADEVAAPKDPARLEENARAVLERGVHRAVILHFQEGAICVRRGEPTLTQASVRVPKEIVVGTAGAGDAFGAGFVLGLHEGWELQRCLELAVCAAAASLRATTCSASIEPWQQCLAFGKKLGFIT
jgi:sugar/nucleoside kinase (ribokinase family)